MEDVKSEKIEYLFLDIEWNQAPGTSDLDGREAIQIGVVAVDEQIQKVKTFSKAIRLSDPKLFNKKTEILSHTPLANIMQGNEEKAVLEKFAQSFPQYCHLIVWSRAAYDLFLRDMRKYGITIKRHRVVVLQDVLRVIAGSGNDQIGFENALICSGSGHILVYAFDVLMEIYREVGYSDRDAALSIVENNLFGMDIDKRAYQLAYFAVMMKARSYNRRALTKGISNNLAVVEESNSIDKFACNGLTTDSEQNKIGEYLVEAYKDAQEIGTLQTIEKKDYKKFVEYLNNVESSAGQIDLFSTAWLNDTLPQMVQLAKQAEIMSNKYAVVCTNPPYMNRLEGQLKKFVVDNYKAYSGDLFSVFIYHNFEYCKEDGYSAFMTPFVWLFIKSYQDLRYYILENKSVVTLVQMEYSAFEEATVPICTFVLSNQRERTNGLYIKLSEFKGGMDVQRIKVLEAIENQKCKYFYETPLKNYYDIEGVPFAFWASERIRKAFKECDCIGKIAPPKQGLATADNDRFLRKWYEIDNDSIGFGYSCCAEALESKKKWFPYNKGGAFRRWYGNREYVVNWENDGYEIKNFRDEKGKLRSRPQNLQYYFKPSITWSDITSASFSGRYSEKGFIFDIKGSSGFPDEKILPYVLGFLNSSVSQKCIKILNPTITTQVGDMARIPVILDEEKRTEIIERVSFCIDTSKNDWNSFETSWDFKKHPLQDADVWGKTLNETSAPFNNMMELYFEDFDIDGLLAKYESGKYFVRYATELTELAGGQKLVRLYDPSGNLIEVRTPFKCN